MGQKREFTGIIEREGDGYTALCPDVDVASQGDTVDEARRNLAEAVALFLESASPSEFDQRLSSSIIRRSGLRRSLFEVN